MPFNWKRTKKLTIRCVLAYLILIILVINDHSIVLSNINTQSNITGHLASHQIHAILSSNSWLPKISFLIVKLSQKPSNQPLELSWFSSGDWQNGATLSPRWMYFEQKSGRLLIPYCILPGGTFKVNISFKEMANQSLNLPQLFLEKEPTKDPQTYNVKLDKRFREIKIEPVPTGISSTESFTIFEMQTDTKRNGTGPKIQWKYTQILNTIEFMG